MNYAGVLYYYSLNNIFNDQLLIINFKIKLETSLNIRRRSKRLFNKKLLSIMTHFNKFNKFNLSISLLKV